MRIVLLVFAFVVVGCGGGFVSSDGGASQGGGSGGGVGGGGGSGGGAGGDAGAQDAGANSRYGYVDAWSVNQSCTLGSTGISSRGSSQHAYFLDYRRVGGPAPAWAPETTVSGACTSYTYGPVPVDDAGYLESWQVSAGDITFTGANTPVTLPFNPDGGYGQRMTNTPWWSGGEALTISAAGAEVPAFTTTLQVPEYATVSAPDLRDQGTPLAVPRSNDLQLSWTGGSGTLHLQMWSGSTSANGTVVCDFPASQHAGTVPAALLQKLPAGAGSFLLQTRSAVVVPSGRWNINVVLTSPAASAENCPLTRPLNFQ